MSGRDNIDDAAEVLEQLRVQNALLRGELATASADYAAANNSRLDAIAQSQTFLTQRDDYFGRLAQMQTREAALVAALKQIASRRGPLALIGIAEDALAAHRKGEMGQDIMHPTGRCSCAGEGKCAWCRTHCFDCGVTLPCFEHPGNNLPEHSNPKSYEYQRAKLDRDAPDLDEATRHVLAMGRAMKESDRE